MLSHNTRLLAAEEYAHDAVKKMQRASSRIAFVTTTFRVDDELSEKFFTALCDAADRGVLVSVCADTLTYIEPKESIFRTPARNTSRVYKAIKIERELKKHGVSFRWLGRSSALPLTGRTHAKWLIIDDTVYSFGGVNMDSGSFKNTDLLLRISNSQLADKLFLLHTRVLKADRARHAFRSYKFTIDDASTVLVDGGLSFDSIIYRRAKQLGKQASSILLVSQYCPTGTLNRILRRGNARLYFNHWKEATQINRTIIRVGLLFSKNKTLYTRDNYLHAKFIIFTMPDGKKIAITGSHNFMSESVIAGTREIALETHDKAIITQLESFFKTHIQ
ncbi:phosphatidylserine/phosphatidylglycerophosphate/cardiolipin synthase family protein [Candidatus Saccharibacteria bacterium]|jgi:cardiolipin synthase|nr:phosphatidylserine/phosphatidylglycerophosphate/cardiolipin synthase family protein [Candidatus Saccharibacteria bacterium]